jgi:hypothetical protein
MRNSHLLSYGEEHAQGMDMLKSFREGGIMNSSSKWFV